MATKKLQILDGLSFVSYNEQNLTEEQKEQVRVNIGAGVPLPETTESHQQLITDADGNKKWEDRTHYVTHVGSVVEVPETTFTTTIDGGQGIAALSNYPENISIGDIREITYDGVIYTCTAYEFAYTPGSIALGNESLMGTDSDTGEPFFWIILPNASNLVTADTVATEHTISCVTIAYDEVHKLSDVYIPVSVPVIQSASANQAVVVESVDENTGEVTGWKTVDVALKSDMSGVLKTADNVEANEDGTISSAVSRVFSIVDASAIGAPLNNYGQFTAQELYDSFSSGFINTRFSRLFIGNTTTTRFCTSWEKKDSVIICYFGDDVAPIIVNPADNTFTLDPDWVAPEETATKSDVAAVQTQIDTLNGTGEGSVKYAVAESVATIVASAPEDFDTLKEIADWIANDETGTINLVERVEKAEADIETLKPLDVQPDWKQTDETAMDFIKNKPYEETADDALEMLNEMGVLEATTNEEGFVLTDENGNILTV